MSSPINPADYVRLVWWYANLVRREGEEYGDVFGVCSLGMLRAAQNYRTDGGAAFSTFAVIHMRGCVQRWRSKERRFRKVKRIVRDHRWRRKALVGDVILFSEFGGDFVRGRNEAFCVDDVCPAEGNEIRELLCESINRLTEREGRALRMRFGLDGGDAMTLQQIADDLGVCKERARQIEMRGLLKLKQLPKIRNLDLGESLT